MVPSRWHLSCPAACAERRQYEREMERLIVEHYSHPSIVIYVVFNEGWGQYEVTAVPAYRGYHFCCFH